MNITDLIYNLAGVALTELQDTEGGAYCCITGTTGTSSVTFQGLPEKWVASVRPNFEGGFECLLIQHSGEPTKEFVHTALRFAQYLAR